MEANLDTLALILGILGAVAAAVVYFRGAWDKGTIASLKESRDALQVLNDQKDKHIIEIDTKNHQLESENKMLSALVTRAADVETLKTSLETYVRAVESQGKHISGSLQKILDTLREVTSNGDR